MIVVEQVERGSDFIAAVYAHASRINADCGHVAPHGSHGIAHAQGLGCALVEGLRKQAGIVAALAEQCGTEQKCECYG